MVKVGVSDKYLGMEGVHAKGLTKIPNCLFQNLFDRLFMVFA
jgi:hypothetical protein